MDQSQTPQPAQTPSQRPGHRDLMYCHECENEWYRDEHGLQCNECGSDFTEIIEDDNDPRDQHMLDHDHDHDDDNESMPSLEEAPRSMGHNYPQGRNPWADDDPDEADISNVQWRQLGPGRFNVTMVRTLSPADLGRGGAGGGAIGGFAALLNNLIGSGRQQLDQGEHQHEHQQGEGQDDREGGGDHHPRSNSGSGTLPGGNRFTYTASARLHPRDPDHPGPRLEPVDELNNVLAGLMAAFGEPPGPHGPHHNHHDHDHDHMDHDHPLRFNPLMGFFASAFPGMGGGQMGDFVYSQEGLDRIISQLMEQNATSNAPPPATQEAIDSLPRKPVTESMLGPEGRAECSICMDEVNLGEEVTELPCHHWFHHQCVAAWLKEHDTCPHCRKGITKRDENKAGNNNDNNGPGGNNAGNDTGSGSGYDSNPSRSMPGAFDAAEDSTSSNPFTTAGSPGQHNAAASVENTGGMGVRLRGWFEPQR
ncbi:hypothetical protein BS50DRAFT_285410 [Corynespora cassiicola Philippines]|uniref:RING-type E3 ubiquitin transferase n=1 Tax=Corynespora cassiicola Philippines TaxID=1448308 RepID=A0A2T2P1I8_CORCC|nr:hypothetical protein BS50DRAFT_285410 [Corynespora cassiicola Philippines]